MKRHLQKSLNVKRPVRIGRHKTSVSLEDAFWKDIHEIAAIRNVLLSDLLATIDSDRQHGNLSSAIRLFVLDYYLAQVNGGTPASTKKAPPPAKPLANATAAGRLGNKAVSKSSELAGKTIDRLSDQSAPLEEQEKRKRRLLKGPAEFRDIRDLASQKKGLLRR
jgi:predicted DNA-binding ribbon-helix-helix protein